MSPSLWKLHLDQQKSDGAKEFFCLTDKYVLLHLLLTCSVVNASACGISCCLSRTSPAQWKDCRVINFWVVHHEKVRTIFPWSVYTVYHVTVPCCFSGLQRELLDTKQKTTLVVAQIWSCHELLQHCVKGEVMVVSQQMQYCQACEGKHSIKCSFLNRIKFYQVHTASDCRVLQTPFSCFNQQRELQFQVLGVRFAPAQPQLQWVS